MSVKVRFAPSPTGRLHVGNVRAAAANWLFARARDGVFVLRIDDTDLERSTKAFEAGIEEDLSWLGLTWGERHNQSARFDIYERAADRLKALGRLYPAYETQEELDRRRRVQLSRGLPPIYDRSALDLTPADRARLEGEGRRPHWRFRLDGRRVGWNDLVRGDCGVDTTSISDPVLIREDGAFLYTLPSVVDDVDMGITHVIRGEDHVTNTGVQVEIFEALGAEVPRFAHMPLLVGADGEALSKRLGSLSIAQIRESGLEPLAVTSCLARIGTSDPLEAAASLEALAEGFDFEKMGRAPARFDLADVERINGQIMHGLAYGEAKSRLQVLGADLGEAFWLAVRPNLGRFEEASEWAQVVRGPVVAPPQDKAFLDEALACLPEEVDAATWSAWTDALKQRTGLKGRALFRPLRQSLTGRDHGPDMGALLPLIGREAIRARLAAAAA